MVEPSTPCDYEALKASVERMRAAVLAYSGVNYGTKRYPAVLRELWASTDEAQRLVKA